ncbi:MAG TPA: BMP family ABC transporter substrate-binding protein [Candidatus Dormibacteraeota bacterium]|nr:BMP family ABC transporter substrate-binding protein [Candidatus Dormibacteraeota bacterium]
MSRRAAAMLLALVLTACGLPSASPDTTQTHVCIATNIEGPAPHTFNQLAIDGARGTGAAVQVITSKTTTDYLSALQRCVAAKPDLVIAVSIDMASAVWHAAQPNTKQKFALVDAMPVDDNGQSAELSNVSGLLFNEQEPAYLVGAMAGLMEKEKIGNASHNVLGVLGSNHGPSVDPYIAGFVTGARDADPSVIFKIAYSDSQDTAFCKQLGITQISAGADLLFEVTGRCASGYIDAAYDASGYAIGSNNDQAFVSPAVITSALKRVDRAVALTIERLKNGQFKPGKQVFSLQDDATGFSTPSSVVPQDIINQVLDLRTKIRNGTITPPDVVPPGV